MSEFMPLHDRVLMYEVESRARRTPTSPTPRVPRPTGRHRLARGLHALADRLDT